MRLISLILVLMVVLSACVAPTATPRSIVSAPTQRPFPAFGPTRTRTPTRTPRMTATATATPTIAATETPTLTPPARASSGKPSGSSVVNQPSAPGKIARAAMPSILQKALIAAGVRDPQVYWFTFDEGDREVALMIQYASPLRWQPGYLDMLRTAQRVLGKYFLSVEPSLYSAFIAGVDITGASDITVRLRRSSAEKLARGEIGEEDFVNNYFEYVNIAIRCTPEACTARMATPFPEFHFPFPFPPTPTRSP